MSRSEEVLGELARVAADPGSATFFVDFEQAVARLAAIGDPSLIGPLLGFLDDEIDPDLGFAIIHTVERFADDVYVPALVRSLRDVLARSQPWLGPS